MGRKPHARDYGIILVLSGIEHHGSAWIEAGVRDTFPSHPF